MELRSGDQLSLVLKNPNDYLGHLGTEFGKKTYKSIVEQTDPGISKFYCILKFIVSGIYIRVQHVHCIYKITDSFTVHHCHISIVLYMYAIQITYTVS